MAIVFGSDEEAAAAAQRLAGTHVFAFGSIGPGGRMPEGELALSRIMVRPNPIRFLRPVFETGTAEACCYVLVAIRGHYPEQLDEFMARFLDRSHCDVATAHGCHFDSKSPEAIVESIKAHAIGWPSRSGKMSNLNGFTRIGG
jgi:hypothetical protein